MPMVIRPTSCCPIGWASVIDVSVSVRDSSCKIVSIRDLYQLQELDWVRAERQQALGEVRAELSDDSTRRRARLRVQHLEAQYNTQNALRRDAQLAVEQIEAREQLVQSRLYGGAVTNPRELEAFQDEQSMLLRQRSEAEDVLLEHMVATEELHDALAEARAASQTLEERRRSRVPQLQQQEQTLTAEIETVNRRRSELLSLFPPQILSTYETLLGSRGGHAVSKVGQSRGRDICEACRVAIPRADTQRVRSRDALVQCNNCRRILYLE